MVWRVSSPQYSWRATGGTRSFEFWVLSYPEVLKDTCRALSENQKLRTQNFPVTQHSPLLGWFFPIVPVDSAHDLSTSFFL